MPTPEGKVPLELRVCVQELQLLGDPQRGQGLWEGDGRAQESWLREGVSLAVCPVAAVSCMPRVYVWARAGCASLMSACLLLPHWAFLTTEFSWCLALQVC